MYIRSQNKHWIVSFNSGFVGQIDNLGDGKSQIYYRSSTDSSQIDLGYYADKEAAQKTMDSIRFHLEQGHRIFDMP